MTIVSRWTGREAKLLRKALRLSVRDFAAHLGIGMRTVNKWEARQGDITPLPYMQEVLDTALARASDEVKARFAAVTRADVPELHVRQAAVGRAEPVLNGDLESPAEILARRAVLHTSNLTAELLAALEQFVVEVVERYEAEGPLVLAPETVRARKLVDQLLAGNQRLAQRARLFELAGRLSGQLSYMAINLGKFGAARAYGAEAFELARFIDNDELSAWVRGTQSLAAYYTGDYKQSLTLARDGQRYAKNSVQAVRLAVNGEARALGKLRDGRAVAEAVSRSYQLLENFPPVVGMTPCISFGIYSEARTASNAATAYLAVADTKQVMAYTEYAMQIVDVSSSQWSRALVRLDTATAFLKARQSEPEGASLLGSEAIDAVGDMHIESIRQRTRELATELRPWLHLGTVADFLNKADSLLATARGGRAAK